MTDLAKHYDFAEIEKKHAAAWRSSNVFAPNMDATDAHAIMMPPPNVTGTLHLGHALDNTLPDILTRRARMQGKAALYQPGTDHASIAVHVVLERQLCAEGKTRFDLGREKFLEKAWEWKEHSQGTIKGQMHRLGISADWANERFTMDEHYEETIQKVFVELYNRNLIYRGQRLVNWDPNMQTAVSDLEVKHKEVEGHLWHFKYPYAGDFTYEDTKTGVSDGIVIATTRPETILADGAIAINPEDPRAKDLVGKTVIVPIIGREIPIIADDYVEPDFGSGMVKITAAHDFNDFDVYNRHKDSVNIPLINLMNKDATMNENCPADYQGLDRSDARQKIIADFKELGLHIKTENYTHQVPTAERDDTVLEPFLTQQWFVKGQPLAEKILKGYENGEFECLNTRDEKVMTHWLNNIQDWCISRQLWWGHRVPAWFKSKENGESEIYVGLNAPEGEGWTQDEDIFDTWFSSALWPFGTQFWEGDDSDANNTRLTKFYPGAAVMNGRDILPFWDIRMLMMGYELTGQAPFKTIYTHGMILDENGQKMSKSKGNVIDPMGMVNTYGADALRFMMASIASAEDMRFSEQKVEQNRNFCTKIWNAARYLQMMDIQMSNEVTPPEATQPVNRWLIAELQHMFMQLDKELDTYQFNQASQTLYHFTWGTWCDWYLEMTKPLLRNDATAEETKATLAWGFDMLLRALHPVMPFITEEIWQSLRGDTSAMLTAAQWPNYSTWKTDETATADINWLKDVVSSLRNARSESNVPPKAKIDLGIKGASDEHMNRFASSAELLNHLTGIASVSAREDSATATDSTAIAHGFEMILPLKGIVDFAAEKERLAKEKAKLEAELEKIEGLLGNESFVARAPKAVVAQNKARAQELADNIAKFG